MCKDVHILVIFLMRIESLVCDMVQVWGGH